MAKGWPGDITCEFCSELESADHLFVICSYVKLIWNWIVSYNNFIFDGINLDDLWLIDACIPLKDKHLLISTWQEQLAYLKNIMFFLEERPTYFKSIFLGSDYMLLKHHHQIYCN